MYFINITLYVFFFIIIALFIADALTALITSETTFHPFPVIQNVLYVLALSMSLSWVISKTESKEDEPLQLPLRFAAIASFVTSTGLSLYVGFALLTTTVYQSPPDGIQFIQAGDWQPIAYLHSAVLLIGAAYSILECIINVSTYSRWTTTTSTYIPMRKIYNDGEKKFYWAYRVVQFSCLIVVFAIIINSYAYTTSIIWQQVDSPHLLTVFAISLSFHIYWLPLKALWAFVFFFALALSVSISQLFFEVERIGDDADWLNVESYIDLFNTTEGVSLPIQNKYKFVTSSSLFIIEFAEGSQVQHLLHIILVSLSTSLFTSIMCIAIGKSLQVRGRSCPLYY